MDKAKRDLLKAHFRVIDRTEDALKSLELWKGICEGSVNIQWWNSLYLFLDNISEQERDKVPNVLLALAEQWVEDAKQDLERQSKALVNVLNE